MNLNSKPGDVWDTSQGWISPCQKVKNNSIALSNVVCERKRQDVKWGEQNHNPAWWIVILLEELGEASKALLENQKIKYRDEMVHVSAVAIAAIESYDRSELVAGNKLSNL